MKKLVRSLTLRSAMVLGTVALSSTAWAGHEGGAKGGSQAGGGRTAAPERQPSAEKGPARLEGFKLPTLQPTAGAAGEKAGAAGETGAEKTTQPGETTAPKGGGMFGMVVDALGEVDLRDDQRGAVDALVDEATIRHAPLVEKMNGLMIELADQVEAGKIDREALRADLETIRAAWSCVKKADLAALEVLHGILTPEQREQFADALGKRVDAYFEKHQSNAWVDELAGKLKLSDEQRDDLLLAVCEMRDKPEIADHLREKRERIDALLEAFRGEEFEADDYVVEEDPAAVEARLTSMLDFADAVLAILTPEQRAAAADLIRAHHAEKEAAENGAGTAAKPGAEAEEEEAEEEEAEEEEAEEEEAEEKGAEEAGGTQQGPAEGDIGKVSQEIIGVPMRGFSYGYNVPYGYVTPFGYGYGTRRGYGYAYGSRRAFGSFYSIGSPFGHVLGWGW